MTRGPVGRRGAAFDQVRRLDAAILLPALLALGLALRVLLAGWVMPLSGFGIDIGDFAAWAQRLASVGPGGFYEAGYFSDYPPGYLYVLWLFGGIGRILTPLVGIDVTPGLVKIPGIVADVAGAWLIFVICRRWGGSLLARPGVPRVGISSEQLGLVAAAAYLFTPGTIFTSAVWGQVDSVGTLLALATIYMLARGWTEAASVGAVLAMLVKFQLGFLLPIVAIVGLKRHLAGRSSDPAHDGGRDTARVAWSLAAGLAAILLALAPFGMTIYWPLAGGDPNGLLGVLPEADPSRSLVGKFIEAAGTYAGLAVNAFNAWRLPFTGASGPLPGLGDTLQWGDDRVLLFNLGGLGVTPQLIGITLFGMAAVLALWQVARRDDLRGVLLACLVLAIAFYALPTRVHERYLFPALAFAAPLVLRSRGWAAVFIGLSVSLFANVYWVYTEDWSFAGPRVLNPGPGGLTDPPTPMAQDPVLAGTLFTNGGIYLVSALSLVVLGIVAWRSVRLALRPTPEPMPEMPAAEPPVPEASLPAPPRQAPVPAAAPLTAAPAAELSGGSRADRFGWLRPDPHDRYLREPTRRLDRLDAALLIGLVLFALLFRVWRLDTPRGVHFDEVYHARSATEWLANWEHGWTRDVYEWTHPMLAKYLIAAGIVVADPNRIVSETDVDEAPGALAIAPARSSEGHPRSVAFGAVGTELSAWDVESGEVVSRWEAGGPVASLAYDAREGRLLVGRADSGSIEAYALDAFLGATGERAPPAAAAPIETGLTAALEIVAAEDAPVILARDDASVASVARVVEAVPAIAQLEAGGIGWLPAGGEQPERLVATVPGNGSLAFLDATTLGPIEASPEISVDAGLTGPLLTRGSGDDQQIFAPTGPLAAVPGEHPATPGGVAVVDADRKELIVTPLPGAAALTTWQPVANLVYLAGTDADGDPALWTMDPHGESRRETSSGFAVFDTTPLPGQPVAMGIDATRRSQADDAGRLLLSTAGPDAGSLVTIDAGSNAFAWRLAGVVFGALLVGLVYLLAATMFGRRRIAILAAGFLAIDGMSYTMSRIAMNDIFVATFIVAAYLLFWQVWSGRWRRSAWWALPAVGVLIGLAAASKWVGFYAMAGLIVLVLARSALGRLVLVGLLAFAAVAGGIGAPWPFLLLMVGVLALALVVVYHRPIRVDPDEVRLALPATGLVLGGIGLAFALAYSSVEGRTPGGGVEVLFSFLARGVEAGWPGWLLLGIAALLIGWRAVASLRDPASDARWWRPAELGGFAWAWVGACLVIVPLAVYLLSYVPYLALGHAIAIPETGPGYHWSLDELHSQMFGYHYGLSAGHASASPWWSWPLALKPTWLFSADYDGRQIATIYNGGNPILFWAGIPALVVCAVLAWRRRSPALVLLAAAFAFQYLPWIRIERATFAYHYLTALPFAMVAVAYLVDEALRRYEWRDLAIGYLAMAVLAAVLTFPLGAALAMPDWYITAARTLPPWNYAFQFPNPPSGERGDLLGIGTGQLVAGVVAAGLAVAFAMIGRPWWERRRANGRLAKPAEG
jgi:predicted membrane-bound dolichyl-phosphate-mannose-protein mannosyltransferase